MLHKIPTGCKEIDETLEGGFPNRKVSLIYGEAETGKTTLAIQCAINCARRDHKTLFVDCDGTFSARRLFQIASRDFENIAGLIILTKPNSFDEQAALIDRLTDYINKNFGLVIIDTFTSLYRAEISEDHAKTFELNRELNRQMACLAQIASTQKMAVLVTSQVRNVFNETFATIEPVANRVSKFWADVIIAMRPTNNPQVIKAVLEKSPQRADPATFYLRMEKTGLREHLTH